MQPIVDDYPNRHSLVRIQPPLPILFYMNGNLMKKNHGFTLIEVMIVLVLSGILLAFAKGAYDNYTSGNSQTGDFRPTSAQRVEDHPNLDNCKPLQDDNRVIYSCPDGKIYTK